MATDKRVKGCSNPECVNHIKKIKMKAENEYCPKCGAELVFVCKKCFKEIQDIDENHSICTHCIEEAQEKKEKRIEKVKDYGKKAAVAAGTGVLAVGGKIVTKVMKDEEKELVKVGVEVAKKGIAAAKNVVLK